jgi:hypothetical protein
MDCEAYTPEYIKRTVERINELTPLRRYAVLDLINSYCNENRIPEPSLNEFRSQDEVDHRINENYRDALKEDLELIKEISDDVQIEMDTM